MASERERSRELLVDELKDAVGEEAVDRTDLDVDRALDRQPSGLAGAIRSGRLLLIVVGAALLVVGVIASLAFDNWIFFGLAIVAHAIFTGIVVASALRLTTEVEKPSPTTEAALQDQGVNDPSGALNDLVEQVSESEEGGEREAAQRKSMTPASEPTRKVGE
jgi:membrane protein implicated in regulation of membrane protease activity